MTQLLIWARRIDTLNRRIGRAAAWLAPVMILLGAGNALARYLGRFTGLNLSSNAYIELQWYAFSVLFLLAGAWVLAEDRHVRVDVLYARWSPRARARLDLGGTIAFLVPFAVVGLWLTWPSVRNSWSVLEISPDPGGLPRYPLKAVVLVAYVLLLLQGVAQIIRQVATLRDPAAPSVARQGGAF